MIITRKCHECGHKNRFNTEMMEGQLHCQECDARIRRSELTFMQKIILTVRGFVDYHRVEILVGLGVVVAIFGIVHWTRLRPEPLVPEQPPGDNLVQDDPVEDTVDKPSEDSNSSAAPTLRDPGTQARTVVGVRKWRSRSFRSTPLWNDSTEHSFPLADLNSLIISPDSVRFLVSGQRRFDVATGEASDLDAPEQAPVRTAISTDGRWMATAVQEGDASAVLFLDGTSSEATSVQLPVSAASLSLFRFLPGNRLLVQSISTISARVFVCTPGSEKSPEFETAVFEKSCASSDGQFLAIASPASVSVFELATGSRVGVMSAPRSNLPMSAIRGIAFAPDGKDLAALMSDGRFVVWDVADGSVRLEFGCENTEIPETTAAVQWLPDGRGWLLAGTLLLSEPLIEAWRVEVAEEAKSVGCLVVDQNHVLVPRKSGKGWSLDPLEIPWDEIQEATLIAKQRTLFQQGASVTLTVEAEDDRLKQSVEDALATRLKAMGCRTTGSGVVKLVVGLAETRGDRKTFIDGQFIDGSGRTVYTTAITCDIQMVARKNQESVWQHSFTSDGGDPPPVPVTTRMLRQRAVDSVLRRLETLTMPGRVLDDPDDRFPILATLGAQAVKPR